MKKIFILLAGVLLLTSFATKEIFAETSSGSGSNRRPEEFQRKEDFKERFQEKTTSIQEKKASMEAKIKETKINLIGKFWERMKKVMLASVERMERISNKIETRMNKLTAEDPNINLTSERKDLEKARGLLTKSRTDIAAIDTQLASVLKSNDPKSAFSGVRTKVKSVRDQLKEAHRLLVHILGKIKGLRNENEISGTPTLSPTMTPTPTPTASPTLTPVPSATLTPTP